MKKILAAMAVAALVSSSAMANTGWLNSYVNFFDGVGTEWYDLNGADQSNGNVDGADLGSFSLGYTLFLNSEINAWADGGDAYSAMSISYRVNGGSFSEITDNSLTDLGGNNFRGETSGGDLSGLGAGTHTIELYVSRSHTWSGGGPFTTSLDVDGDTAGGAADNYFTATFTVVPEPGTLALFGLGMAGLAVARRRRA